MSHSRNIPALANDPRYKGPISSMHDIHDTECRIIKLQTNTNATCSPSSPWLLHQCSRLGHTWLDPCVGLWQRHRAWDKRNICKRFECKPDGDHYCYAALSSKFPLLTSINNVTGLRLGKNRLFYPPWVNAASLHLVGSLYSKEATYRSILCHTVTYNSKLEVPYFSETFLLL